MKLNARVTKKIETRQMLKDLDKILDEYAAQLDPILDAQFTSEKWPWTDRVTRRRNGQEVGSPRDIVDTGELLNSKSGPKPGKPRLESDRDPDGNPIRVRPEGVRRYWIWDTPYAEPVKNGTSQTMPRDWIKGALEELPFEPYVKAAIAKLRGRR